MSRKIDQELFRIWYQEHWLAKVLRPLSWLFCALVVLRRFLYRAGIFKSVKLKVPVVVVGNLTVGGTGKTPLTIWLVNYLKASGYSPGVISRGYGGKAKRWPQQVRPDADAVIVGDEAIVISRQTRCPMAVGPDRVQAAEALLHHARCDIIVSDDGLQHYRLKRSVEVATVDGFRRFGNGWCLPAGPMREPASRLNSVDFVIAKGTAGTGEYLMKYNATNVVSVSDNTKTRKLNEISGKVHAVAGVGNPEPFFQTLKDAGLEVIEHALSDHHVYGHADIEFGDKLPVIMTEKDAVKCKRFAGENCWYLNLSVDLPEEFGPRLLNLLEERNG